MPIDLSRVSSLSGLHFPFYVAKYNCQRHRLQMVKYDVLRQANFRRYWGDIARWRDHTKGLDRHTQEIYANMTSRISLASFCLTDSSLPVDFASALKVLVFASTRSGIEGIRKLIKGENSYLTAANIIGNAPWNIRTKRNAPKFQGIAEDLMRISLLISLHLATGAKDDTTIYFVSFVTARGKSFARRFFNISGVIPARHPVTVEINKHGVESFLLGDHESFRLNCRALGKSPLEIAPLDVP